MLSTVALSLPGVVSWGQVVASVCQYVGAALLFVMGTVLAFRFVKVLLTRVVEGSTGGGGAGAGDYDGEAVTISGGSVEDQRPPSWWPKKEPFIGWDGCEWRWDAGRRQWANMNDPSSYDS